MKVFLERTGFRQEQKCEGAKEVIARFDIPYMIFFFTVKKLFPTRKKMNESATSSFHSRGYKFP